MENTIDSITAALDRIKTLEEDFWMIHSELSSLESHGAENQSLYEGLQNDKNEVLAELKKLSTDLGIPLSVE